MEGLGRIVLEAVTVRARSKEVDGELDGKHKTSKRHREEEATRRGPEWQGLKDGQRQDQRKPNENAWIVSRRMTW